MWLKLLGPALKLLTWLGQTLFVWKAAKDDARADASEKTLQAVARGRAPLSDPELERVRQKYRRD